MLVAIFIAMRPKPSEAFEKNLDRSAATPPSNYGWIILATTFMMLASVACDRTPDLPPSDVERASQHASDSPPSSAEEPFSSTRTRIGDEANPPNIVLILGDDIGVDLVGAYAQFFPPTPAPNTPDTPVLDALAREGVLFRNVWTNPGCSPSRAQVLTGRHARRTGIGGLVKWRVPGHRQPPRGLSQDFPLLPQVLKAGALPYDTAAVGKWHLASPDQGELHALGRDGAWFDRWAGSSYNLNGEGVGYGNWPKSFATAIRDHDACGPPYPCQRMLRETHACQEYATVDTTNDALHLVRTLEEPFFLYVSYNAPHTPLQLPKCALPESCTAAALPFETAPTTEPELTRAMTRTLDHEIGRLLCEIDREDTVVIFMGDNGTAGDGDDGRQQGIAPPFPGAHGKATMYNGGINVPLIVRGPGIAPSVSEALVNSTDLFATLAELAGVAQSISIPSDSVSIAPYLRGETHPHPRETIVAERFTPTFFPRDIEQAKPSERYHAKIDFRAIRNERFKLIERRRDGHFENEEFYDLLSGGRLDATGTPGRDDFEHNDLILRRATWRAGGELEANYLTLKRTLEIELPPLP